MFTGLVEHQGRVRSVVRSASGLRLTVDPVGWMKVHAAGDSIAVNGCCLTAVADAPRGHDELVFDAIPETLSKTTLGTLGVGDRVNLEQAASMGTLLGGHVMQGHVDGVGEFVSVRRDAPVEGGAVAAGGIGTDWLAAAQCRIRIRPPAELMPFIIPKGSIAVDGVSLTIAAIDPRGGWFEVALIPTTLERTTLGGAVAGQRCNLEADPMAKTVVHYLRHYLGNDGLAGAAV